MRLPAVHSLPKLEWAAALAMASVVLLTVVTLLAGQVSRSAFVASGIALVALIAAIAYRYPKSGLALLMVAPLLDRSLLTRVIPPGLAGVASLFDELLLVVIAAAVLLRGVREGRARRVMFSTPSLLLAAFVALAGISAAINGVSPLVGLLGVGVTIDAVALLLLAPLAGFEYQSTRRILWSFTALIGVACLITVAQAAFGPSFLGLGGTAGRSGEGVRLSSLVGNPNGLGVLIGMTIALPIASMAFSAGRVRALSAVVALTLAVALLFTFSRGAWFGTVAALVVAAFVTRRFRVLPFAAAVAVVAVVIATILPRGGLAAEAVPSAAPDVTARASAGPSSAPASAAPSARNVPSSNFIGTAIDRALRVVSGSDLRSKLVRNAVPIAADHLLLGVGPGRYGGAVADWYRTPVYPAYGTDHLLTYEIGFKKFFHQQTVDNFWLHLVIEAGLLGTIAFVGLLLVPLSRIARAARHGDGRIVLTAITAGTLAGIFTSFTTMLLEGNAGAFPFWLLLGAGWSIVEGRDARGA